MIHYMAHMLLYDVVYSCAAVSCFTSSNQRIVTRSTFGPCNFHCNMTIAGLGMYEANGPDMFEASSEQLSSFIHWYFWCVHIDRLIVF